MSAYNRHVMLMFFSCLSCLACPLCLVVPLHGVERTGCPTGVHSIAARRCSFSEHAHRAHLPCPSVG